MKIIILGFILFVQVRCFKHSIDLGRCDVAKKDATCFVRDSCIERNDTTTGQPKPGDDNILAQYGLGVTDGEKLKDNACDVVIQIKPFSKKKWHVMMQVNTTKSKETIDINSGISFTQDKLQFNCLPEVKPLVGGLKPERFGGREEFTSNLIFCSITIENEDIPEKFRRIDAKPSLTYTIGGVEQKIEYPDTSLAFWMLPKIVCDVEEVSTGENKNVKYKLYEVDKTLSDFKCNDESRILMIDDKDGLREVEKLYCHKDYHYHYVEGAKDDRIKFDAATPSFKAYCAEKVLCSWCDDLPHDTNLPKTQKPGNIPGTNVSCKIATCESGMWRLSDGSVEKAEVECDKNDEGNASWFMKIEQKARREISNGSCSKEYDCLTYSKLNLLSTDDCAECPTPDYSPDKETISCFTEGYDLIVGSNTVSNLTCITDTGYYKNGDVRAEKEQKIFCKKKAVAAPAAAAAGMSGGEVAGTVIGVLCALAIVACLVIFFLKRRRRLAAQQQKTQPTSLVNSEDMKTAIYCNSKEELPAKQSQSGSEAPPSTDRPSKERMPSSGEEKKEEAKDEKKDDKKEDKKTTSKKSIERKPVPDTLRTKKELEAQLREKREGIDMKESGKRVDSADLDLEQLKFAREPGSKIKRWTESLFKDLLLPDVHVFKVRDRLSFLRNLTAFCHYGKKMDTEFGTLTQFFLVVKKCMDKKLDCPPSWEIIYRTVKLFCHHLPQKEGAALIARMKTMMTDCGRMMVKRQGFVRRMREDNDDHMLARGQAMRILLWAEDPLCLEALKSAGESKPEEVDPSVQMAVFSYAVNNLGKREEMEARLREEMKAGMENPHPMEDKHETMPFGTLRQHLIYALCSNKDEAAAADFLRNLVDFNSADLLLAFMGAVEHCGHFEKTLAIFEEKPVDCDEIETGLLDKFCKTAAEKQLLIGKLKADYIEMINTVALDCVSHAQFVKMDQAAGPYKMYAVKPGSNDYDASIAQERANNLDKVLKHKKCVEWMDEAMKKANY